MEPVRRRMHAGFSRTTVRMEGSGFVAAKTLGATPRTRAEDGTNTDRLAAAAAAAENGFHTHDEMAKTTTTVSKLATDTPILDCDDRNGLAA